MRTIAINRTSSGALTSGPAVLEGFYVNSTTSGTVKFWNNTTGVSGENLTGTITPAIGHHNLFGMKGTVALYADFGGTADITFFIRDEDL